MKRQILHTLLPMLVVLMTACQSRPKNVRQVDELPAIWPDYTAVTIPATIAPLNFAMADDVETIDVTVKGSKGGEMHVNGSYADFDIDEWHELLAANKGGAMTVTVCAEKDGGWTQYRDFQSSSVPTSWTPGESPIVAFRPAMRFTAGWESTSGALQTLRRQRSSKTV